MRDLFGKSWWDEGCETVQLLLFYPLIQDNFFNESLIKMASGAQENYLETLKAPLRMQGRISLVGKSEIYSFANIDLVDIYESFPKYRV